MISGVASVTGIIAMLFVVALWVLGIVLMVMFIQIMLMARKILKWYIKKNDIV